MILISAWEFSLTYPEEQGDERVAHITFYSLLSFNLSKGANGSLQCSFGRLTQSIISAAGVQ